MKNYDYAHRTGIEEISWDRFAELAALLAEQLSAAGAETIVGIARAGLFPGTTVGLSLHREFYPVRVTRRLNGIVTYEHPLWKVDVSDEVRGRVVAVVDEMADSGETLQVVAARAREKGAARVITTSLYSHSWADPMPDVVARVSDAFVIFPWDVRFYQDGRWQPDPEVEAGRRLQQ